MRPCVFSISKDNGYSRKSRDSKTIEVMMKKLSELTKDKSGLIAGISGGKPMHLMSFLLKLFIQG